VDDGLGINVRRTLESIYREHRQGLFTLALSITRRADAAEDAVQAAFVRLFRSPARPGGDATAYVFAAVRNAALDTLRRGNGASVPAASIFNGQAADHRDPASAAIGRETHEAVRRAIESLPDSARQTVVLKLYAGLTFDQIAQTLGEPMGTVTSRYRRALDKLREQLIEKV
jgi:RNA polymerase sigma-70 factor, ECF subfamily